MMNAVLMTPGTYGLGTVIALGLGIVFVGLICIVFLCYITGKVVGLLQKKEAPQKAVPAAPAVAEAIPNRGELVAAISCCLAEELGTDVQAIRIVSLKKV